MRKNVWRTVKNLAWAAGGVFGAGVAAATGWLFYSRKYIQHDIALDEALEAERTEFVSEHAGRLSYYHDTSAKGTPLVLLHGINVAPSAFDMKPFFDRYRDKRPVFALDLPGFGFSDRSERVYSPSLYQRAITDFLTDVVGKPADVVALSLTCEFIALSALHSAESTRSLVMISPTGFQPPKTGKLAERAEQHGAKNKLYSGLAVGLWNQSFYDLVATRLSIDYFLNLSFEGLVPERMVDYAYQTSHQPGAQYAPTYFLSGKLFNPAVRETVYRLVVQPVLVIYDRDPRTNFEMLSLMLNENDRWHGVRVSPTKGFPHWEQPEKTFLAMDAFWNDL